MTHYFDQKPDSEHEFGRFEATWEGITFQFTTDHGVFSRKRLDDGTDLLVNSVLKHEPDAALQMLDLGTGVGVMAIALAKLRPSFAVMGSDINERAVSLAIKNARHNKVENVRFLQADGVPISKTLSQAKSRIDMSDGETVPQTKSHTKMLNGEDRSQTKSRTEIMKGSLGNYLTGFDLIVLNPPIRTGKDTVYRLFREARDHLNASGRLYIVIRVKQGAASAIKELSSYFGMVETINRGKGYHVIKATVS